MVEQHRKDFECGHVNAVLGDDTQSVGIPVGRNADIESALNNVRNERCEVLLDRLGLLHARKREVDFFSDF